MNITEQASTELKKVLNNFESPGAGIHIYNAQGCCGPSIQMDIANQPANNEIVVNLEGIDFFVDKELLKTLAAVTIDFGSNGFRLNGLQKSGGCCG
jgi:Fe-S cluster assembly iron-binding protein IscA